MATSLNSNNVGFTNYALYDGDSLANKQVDGLQFRDRWAWGYNAYTVGLYGRSQLTRGGYYVSRMIYGTTTLVDGYGVQYQGAGLYYPSNTVTASYDSLVYANTSLGRSINVKIEMNIGRATDDATQSILFRGGTPTPSPSTGPASSGGHTGGTQIYISGGTSASYLAVTEVIPANTTYTYWHYLGITGGSGTDGCTGWLTAKFMSFN